MANKFVVGQSYRHKITGNIWKCTSVSNNGTRAVLTTESYKGKHCFDITGYWECVTPELKIGDKVHISGSHHFYTYLGTLEDGRIVTISSPNTPISKGEEVFIWGADNTVGLADCAFTKQEIADKMGVDVEKLQIIG